MVGAASFRSTVGVGIPLPDALPPEIIKLVVVPNTPNVADIVLMPHCCTVKLAPPEGDHAHVPVRTQSPAVNDSDVMLAAIPVVRFPVVVGPADGFSPMLPAAGLSFVVVPLMPTALAGVIRPLAVTAAAVVVRVSVGLEIVEDVPNTSAPLPVSSDTAPASCADVVDANCASVPLVRANALPHENPVPLEYCSALLVVLPLGNDTAPGAAVLAVLFPRTEFAAIVGRIPYVTLCHDGAAVGPFDAMT
ncbi:hypothetical protein [Burkholderia vietnamiensis]|uniref:hypothetical protein n=1 Tax=Burkholderia vietnamiensis TaxID=60552 RepID=UPI000841A00E|nr:hypothetical protein [Burkholderia vietnamiensis]AOK40854.1 hypothetical protein WL96_07245 [Burkholderia vietnamiensis]